MDTSRFLAVQRLPATSLVHALWPVLSAACLAITGCSGSPDDTQAAKPPPRTLHVLGWADFLDADVIPRFERETGIKVVYDVVDSSATMDAKLMVGSSGYDVAFPAPSFVPRQIAAGVYRPLDKSLLPNLANLDPQDLQTAAKYDPGNRYSLPFDWTMYGIAIDTDKVRARLPTAPLDGWGIVFDPAQAAKLADCGIAMYDSPHFMIQLAYQALGIDPASEADADLARVAASLHAIRPHIRKIDTSASVNDLAAGEVCVSVTISTDFMVARDRALEAKRPFPYEFVIPREGTTLAGDMIAILADAKHPSEAHAFIDFLMDPVVAAANTNFSGMPNAVPASRSSLRPSLANDPLVFPSAETRRRFRLDTMVSEQGERDRTRVWSRFVANEQP